MRQAEPRLARGTQDGHRVTLEEGIVAQEVINQPPRKEEDTEQHHPGFIFGIPPGSQPLITIVDGREGHPVLCHIYKPTRTEVPSLHVQGL